MNEKFWLWRHRISTVDPNCSANGGLLMVEMQSGSAGDISREARSTRSLETCLSTSDAEYMTEGSALRSRHDHSLDIVQGGMTCRRRSLPSSVSTEIFSEK